MTEMTSRAIADTRVYAQATEPTDTRDGIIWVDTSTAARNVFVYSTDTPGWEPVSPGIVSADPTAPDNPTKGDVWIDTDATPQRVNQWTGSQWTGLTNFGEFDTHRSDTANPHSVTAGQVGAPTQTEFDNHEADSAVHHTKPTVTQNSPSVTAWVNSDTPTTDALNGGDYDGATHSEVLTFSEVRLLDSVEAVLAKSGQYDRDIVYLSEVEIAGNDGSYTTVWTGSLLLTETGSERTATPTFGATPVKSVRITVDTDDEPYNAYFDLTAKGRKVLKYAHSHPI